MLVIGHDDAGILTHHIGITWEFENNLRKIDTRTAAHYWDCKGATNFLYNTDIVM